MRKSRIPWEMSAGVDRAALVASLTKHVLSDVDEVARHHRLLLNAREAVAIAQPQDIRECLDVLARSEVELAVAVSMLVSSRGHLLEAEELAKVGPLTEAERWDAADAEIQAAAVAKAEGSR